MGNEDGDSLGQSTVLTQTPMLQYLAPQPTKAASTNVTG
ncbi:hypothetical protein ALO95_101525 [Pseudomonas syringae pv. antirrhini]|uniref:Uncharacterized protein n=1 Tax=Pseudomonas syringae pv. antirrhini TaxID=251702 RepID=A0A0P9JSW8_9PSED|nr:hypothetical protein ALO88_101804 [Pseudomonas syringae pv. antirrhini]MCF5225595.1 hypothetical protein [Pseudomonas syringae]POQ07521.1 hypothetical protein CXB40_14390 [Pseudomonas syringae pv. avii]RMR24769.1 hypothetical protein ALP89_101667 [Pseudomonas syringae pv. persicae]MCF5241337.1 hypothetical protein [Pseudomonas syringae]